MKFTKIPSTTFQKIQLNAGVLLSEFDPAQPVVQDSKIIGATSGGNSFEATPSFVDFGEDIDNCPKNMKELKQLESWDVKMSGTFVTLDTASAKRVVGAADVSESDSTKIVPRSDLVSADFTDIWWVGDYSDETNDTKGGFIAIKMMNALSTGGLKIQSSDKAKGQFAYEFTAHVSMAAQEVVPFEVYIVAGEAEGQTAGSGSVQQ